MAVSGSIFRSVAANTRPDIPGISMPLNTMSGHSPPSRTAESASPASAKPVSAASGAAFWMAVFISSRLFGSLATAKICIIIYSFFVNVKVYKIPQHLNTVGAQKRLKPAADIMQSVKKPGTHCVPGLMLLHSVFTRRRNCPPAAACCGNAAFPPSAPPSCNCSYIRPERR